MTPIQMVLAVLLIIVSILLVIVVLLQKNREASASAVMGGDSSFFDKTKGHQKDATLATITKVLGVVLFVLACATLGVNLFA